MTMMEMGGVSRFDYSLQSALRGGQRNGHPSPEWITQAEAQLEQLRYRLKDSLLAERALERMYEAIHDGVRERVREVVRERLPSELRGALLGATGEPGIDFGRIERRVIDRLTDAITDRLASTIQERAPEPIRDWIAEGVREAASGTVVAPEVERVSARLREHIEPAITGRRAEAIRERVR